EPVNLQGASPGCGSGNATIGFSIGDGSEIKYLFRGPTGMRFSQSSTQVVPPLKESSIIPFAIDQPHLFDFHTASSVAQFLENTASDHLPFLVEIDLKVELTGAKNLHWNFKKADWSLNDNISNDLISQKNLFQTTGKDFIKLLISQREELLNVIAQNGGMGKQIELKKLNAEIKKIYVQFKISNWKNLCEKLDYRASNTKLWKLSKQIHKLKLCNEEINAIISNNVHVSVDDREVAERSWLSITQMKVGLLLVVLTNTWPEPPEFK
ncbi:RNase H domain-containing protein, partial [Trichonephila inaurata madagascariensis]